jgi:hypothetical protein
LGHLRNPAAGEAVPFHTGTGGGEEAR